MGLPNELQAMLEVLLGSDRVYFQPPPNASLTYPCIVYKMSDVKTRFADDKPYSLDVEYTITIIHRDPDSLMVLALLMKPKTRFHQRFVSDNLYHDVVSIFV